MASPSTTLVTQSPELNTLFEFAYSETERSFVAPMVYPVFQVPRQAGNFGRVTLESLMEHSTDLRRAPASGYRRRQMEFTADTYATSEYGIEELIDERERNMYASYFDAQAVATARAANTVLTGWERRTAAKVFDTTFYTSDAKYNQAAGGTGTWAADTSTPLADIEGAYVKVRDNTGMRPNAIVMNEIVFRTLRNYPDVFQAVSSEGAGDQRRVRDITRAQLAAVLDIDQVIVAGGMYNTSNPNAEAVLDDIWSDHVLVCRIAETMDMQEPCLGRTFNWGQDGSVVNGLIETYEEPQTRSLVVRVRHDLDEHQLYPEAGCMIIGVLTP